MSDPVDSRAGFRRIFGGGGRIRSLFVPGRVNLIGEHIDYHGLAVLPIAIRRGVRIAYRARGDRRIRVVSEPYGAREFEWTPALQATASGDWENYLRAAAQTVAGKWGVGVGIDASITADLPPAAGLSSSTALLVGITLALLRANGRDASFEELMEVLPEGEQFTGTRGGGMDHAAVLASRAGCASLIEFDPVAVRAIGLPAEWGLLAAHSMVTAEKSGAAREEFNARRRAGATALERLGFLSYHEAIETRTPRGVFPASNAMLFLHVTAEALRVREAVAAIEHADVARFGTLLTHSHESLRDLLRVSCPALDRLVAAALDCGAAGARLTGAGFGGFAVILCGLSDRPRVRRCLIERYYAMCPDFDEARHLIDADPGPGVLAEEEHAAPDD